MNTVDCELLSDVNPIKQDWHVFALPGNSPMSTDGNCSPLTNNVYHINGYDSDGYCTPANEDGNYADDHSDLSLKDEENGTAWNSNNNSGVGSPAEFMDVFFHQMNIKVFRQLRGKEEADVITSFNVEYVAI